MDTKKQRLKALREQAVLEGRCYVCRARRVKKGHKTCRHCLGLAAARSAMLSAKGLCVCGARAYGYGSCSSCRFSAARRRESIGLSELAIGNCYMCHRPRESVNRTRCNACLDTASQHQRRRRPAVEARVCSVCRKATCRNKKIHTRQRANTSTSTSTKRSR